MNAPNAPFPRSYWVSPGELLAGLYPGDADQATAHAKLKAMLDCGIRHVVNLMEEDTAPRGSRLRPYRQQLTDLAKDMGLDVTYSHWPIVDYGVPTADTMRSILDDIDQTIAGGRAVYVHCMGGIGRTGTVVGCYLSRHGIAVGPDALTRISELRSGDPYSRHVASPESREQREMVRRWRAGQ